MNLSRMYHEEAPLFARPAEVPDRLRPLMGFAIDEEVEVDDGDAARAVCSGTFTVLLAVWEVRTGHDRLIVQWRAEGGGERLVLEMKQKEDGSVQFRRPTKAVT